LKYARNGSLVVHTHTHAHMMSPNTLPHHTRFRLALFVVAGFAMSTSTSSSVAAHTPSSNCTHLVSNPAGPSTHLDLSAWRGVTLVGPILPPGADGGPTGTFNLSLCGDLSRLCIDELTKVPMPPGTLYSMFAEEPSGRCWDVLARWEHLVAVVVVPPPRVGSTLRFSRLGQ
jgi:hypothetical protein